MKPETTNQLLLDALLLIYDKYENGDPSYDDDNYMGNCVHLSGKEEDRILAALESAGIRTALRKETA